MADSEPPRPKRPRRKPALLPDTPDPIEIAMAQANEGAGAESPAIKLLEKQGRLIDVQQALALADLKHRGWQIMGERTGAAVKGLTALTGILFLAAVGMFVWSAAEADGVVVKPFAVPPDLERRGLTGPVVAAQFLDRLTGLQAETESMRASSTYANDWGGDIQVEIPYAGVSVGELRRYLAEWLGSQTRLSGEIFRLPDGRIAVTTRVGASSGARFEGREAELDALLARGAEAVYAQTQPYRYTSWLSGNGRGKESKARRLALTGAADENDRLWAHISLGTTETRYRDKIRHYETALLIRPDFITARFGIAAVDEAYGNEERAFRGASEVIAQGRALRREVQPGRAEYALHGMEADRARLIGDYRGAIAANRLALAQPTVKSNKRGTIFEIIGDHARLHDGAAARRTIAGEAGPEATGGIVGLTPVLLTPEVAAAWATGDHPALSRLLEQRPEMLRAQDEGGFGTIRALLAAAQARSGRVADAAATIRPTPLDCDPCLRARGLIAQLAGNAAVADRWFGETVRRTPSLPLSHGDWAEVLLMRGEAGRAIEQARLAARKGPRWADPLKLWGDALMRQGQAEAAADRYEAAAERAPRWGALHIAWGQALWRAGEREAARARFRAAAGMDLSAADRARLRRIRAAAQGRTA